MERKITDKKELVRLVSFLCMCDGGLYVQTKRRDGNKKNCNPKFIMNSTSEPYVDYAKSILDNVTTTHVRKRKDYNTDGYNRSSQLRIESRRHPFFRPIWERTYRIGYKGIDTHALKMIDPECLAMMYMADGSISFKGNAVDSCTINTKRLTEGDNRFLSFIINKEFGVETTVNRQYHYTFLRVKGKSIYKFFKIIKPYILDGFEYKVPNDELLNKYIQDDDIVCTASKGAEVDRNDQPPSLEGVTK